MKAYLKDMSKPIKLIFTALFMAYVLLLVYLTFFSKYYGREIMHRNISIIPFRTIIQFLTSGYVMNSVITNIAGNIVAFMPMGFLLPIVFSKLGTFRRVYLAVLFATILIEVAQYFVGVGASDIDDVILNVLGGTIGYLMYRLLAK